jgi:hypothetical protein
MLKQAPPWREDKLQLVQMQCDDKAYKCFDDFGMQLNAYVQDHDAMLESRGDNTSITNSPTKCSTICLSHSAVRVVVVSSATLVTLLAASASAPASLRLSCKYCHSLLTGNCVIPKHVTRAISSKLSFSDVVVHLVRGGKQQSWCSVHVPTPIPLPAPTSSPAATMTMLTTSPAAPSRYITNSIVAYSIDGVKLYLDNKVHEVQITLARLSAHYSVMLVPLHAQALDTGQVGFIFGSLFNFGSDTAQPRQPWPPPVPIEFIALTILLGCSSTIFVFDRGRNMILFEEMIVVHQVMLKPDSPTLVDKGQESLILNFEHVCIPVKRPWSVVRLEDDSFPNECASHNTWIVCFYANTTYELFGNDKDNYVEHQQINTYHGQGIQMQKLARLLCAEVFNSWSGKRLLINGYLLEMSPWCREYVVFVQLQIAWPPLMQPNISFKSVELRQSPWSSLCFYLSAVLQFSSWLPTMIKQQEINIVPSYSASLVTLDEPLDGIMGFTKSSTKFYLGIALVFAECDGHLLHSQECISGYVLMPGQKYTIYSSTFMASKSL